MKYSSNFTAKSQRILTDTQKTYCLTFLKSRSDSADLHGHFQPHHTHSLSFSVSVFWLHYSSLLSSLLCPETSSWIKSTVFLRARLQVSAEKTPSLSFSPFFLSPPSLSDKSKWNGSFHPSYLGQAMEYAVLCKEMERNDLWPTKTSR